MMWSNRGDPYRAATASRVHSQSGEKIPQASPSRTHGYIVSQFRLPGGPADAHHRQSIKSGLRIKASTLL